MQSGVWVVVSVWVWVSVQDECECPPQHLFPAYILILFDRVEPPPPAPPGSTRDEKNLLPAKPLCLGPVQWGFLRSGGIIHWGSSSVLAQSRFQEFGARMWWIDQIDEASWVADFSKAFLSWKKEVMLISTIFFNFPSQGDKEQITNIWKVGKDIYADSIGYKMKRINHWKPHKFDTLQESKSRKTKMWHTDWKVRKKFWWITNSTYVFISPLEPVLKCTIS